MRPAAMTAAVKTVLGRRTSAWAPLLGWTAFVWASRIRNIWLDDSLGTAGQILRTGYALVFLGLAAVAFAVLRGARERSLRPVEQRALLLFLAWTVVFWLIRGIGIIVDDHDLGFTVVHTVLMIISIVLVGWALRSWRTESERVSISASAAG